MLELKDTNGNDERIQELGCEIIFGKYEQYPARLPSLNLFLAAPAWVSNPGPPALNASTLLQSHIHYLLVLSCPRLHMHYQLLQANSQLTIETGYVLYHERLSVVSSMQYAGLGTRGTGTCKTGTAVLGHAELGQRFWDMRNWDSGSGTCGSGTVFIV